MSTPSSPSSATLRSSTVTRYIRRASSAAAAGAASANDASRTGTAATRRGRMNPLLRYEVPLPRGPVASESSSRGRKLTHAPRGRRDDLHASQHVADVLPGGAPGLAVLVIGPVAVGVGETVVRRRPVRREGILGLHGPAILRRARPGDQREQALLAS